MLPHDAPTTQPAASPGRVALGEGAGVCEGGGFDVAHAAIDAPTTRQAAISRKRLPEVEL